MLGDKVPGAEWQEPSGKGTAGAPLSTIEHH